MIHQGHHRWGLLTGILTCLALFGCQSQQPVIGKIVAADTPGAGRLTLRNRNEYWVLPESLKFTGSATFVWPDRRTYNGSWLDGLPNGAGEGEFSDGSHYQGEWHAGQPHGHGELRKGTTRYVGNLVKGKRSGEGAQTSDAGLYRGQWHNDAPHGDGEYKGNNGASYSGAYQAGTRHGYGVFVAANKSRYNGDWRADKPHGFGTQTGAAGREYRGGWAAGRRHGYGQQQDPLGSSYEGTWVNDKRHGYGRATLVDGASYEGEWAENTRYGYGRARLADGTQHAGNWLSNQPSGPATRKTTLGIRWRGHFHGQHLPKGSLQLPSGAKYEGTLFPNADEIGEALLQWVRQQAQQDDPAAQFLMGTFYTDYSNPQASLQLAREWFEAAAKRLPEAQYRLGLLLLSEDPSAAIKSLLKAAKNQQVNAHVTLGQLYHGGDVVQANAEMARHHYEQAMAQGSIDARNNLAWLLATSQEAHLRDPQHAIVLSEPLARLHGRWEYLDTLAAAYAAAGRYHDAVTTAEQALQILALQTPRNQTVPASSTEAHTKPTSASPEQQLQQRLDYYRAEKPYVEILITD